jgi:hypothetical protein
MRALSGRVSIKGPIQRAGIESCVKVSKLNKVSLRMTHKFLVST